MHRFQAFNLDISSELYFPELLMCSNLSKSPDVQITFGNVSPDGLDIPLKSGAFFQANQKNFWLNVPQIARYLVTEGERIVVDPYVNADEESLRVFILDSCFKALLNQQNFVVLEGSAIKMGPYAILFVAPSGFGKSTLCSLFLKRGYCILTDEICAVNTDINLLPSYPAIHLWLNISQQLGIDVAPLKTIRPRVAKYRLNWEKNIYPDPLPIKLIYILNYHKKESLVFTEIISKTKLNVLKTGSFLPPYLVIPEQIHHDLLSRLAHDVQFINLTCPRWDYTMNQVGYLFDQIFDAIEKDIMERTAYHGQH